MTDILMILMAGGAVLGGVDHMLGNRLGFGQRFEEAFRLLGAIALSMVGIICLAPVLSAVIGILVVPICGWLGFDPGIFGGVLAIDMGGYQMAMDLAADPAVGRFAGIILSATFGCTVVFTIPVGMGAIREEDRPHFTKGILLGLITMPGGILTGGFVSGMDAGTLLWNCIPVFLVSTALCVGLWKFPARMMRLFGRFAKAMEWLAILGLTLGAVQYMTGWAVLPKMIPLEEAMAVACSISIVMLGSMPLAELLQRILAVPFGWVGKHTGLNQTSTTGLLVGMVSVTPALAMVPRMDNRGKVVNGAFLVCAASAFAAHLGYTLTAEPDLAAALLTAKFTGGALAVILALAVTGKKKTP